MSEDSKRDICGVGIAIVEDEKAMVELYKKLFAKKGIEICFVAYNGREALEKFIGRLPKPRVIIMDHRLPTMTTMTGIDVTREIMKMDPKAKIIFVSADISVREEALEAGAVEFLKKPASIKDVLHAVEDAMESVLALK